MQVHTSPILIAIQTTNRLCWCRYLSWGYFAWPLFCYNKKYHCLPQNWIGTRPKKAIDFILVSLTVHSLSSAVNRGQRNTHHWLVHRYHFNETHCNAFEASLVPRFLLLLQKRSLQTRNMRNIVSWVDTVACERPYLTDFRQYFIIGFESIDIKCYFFVTTIYSDTHFFFFCSVSSLAINHQLMDSTKSICREISNKRF